MNSKTSCTCLTFIMYDVLYIICTLQYDCVFVHSHLPGLNVDQLRSSIDSLSHIVRDLSMKVSI